jgi:hypothetical protein
MDNVQKVNNCIVPSSRTFRSYKVLGYIQLDSIGAYITIFYITGSIRHAINVEMSYLTTLLHTYSKFVFRACVFPSTHFLKHVNFLDTFQIISTVHNVDLLDFV